MLIVICGPTATGKTKLGVALAHRYNGEVISADSMQLYRGMAIGTAQPTEEEKEGIPHHMIAVADPRESYSAARYAKEASYWVEDILSRGRQPILVGGTGLYIDALLTGRDYAPAPSCRADLQRRAEQEGLYALWTELQSIDPQAAARIHPNDAKRVIRALEIWYDTGETITRHDQRTKALPPRYQAVTLALTCQDRQDLYTRIDARVDEMLRLGLLQEVQALLGQNLPLESTALQAIGYKELIPVLQGTCPLEAAVEAVKRRSRQYAKRQLTWFRRKEGLRWLEMGKNPDFSAAIQISTGYLQEKGLR